MKTKRVLSVSGIVYTRTFDLKQNLKLIQKRFGQMLLLLRS